MKLSKLLSIGFYAILIAAPAYAATQNSVKDLKGWGTGVLTAVQLPKNTAGGPVVTDGTNKILDAQLPATVLSASAPTATNQLAYSVGSGGPINWATLDSSLTITGSPGSAVIAASGGGSSTATGLASATTTINVSAASAPSAGQVLTATDATHATWTTKDTPVTLISAAMDYNTTGNAYTIPQGTNVFINTSNYVSGGLVITFPASPVNGQYFTLNVGPSEIQGLGLNGNGNTILGDTTAHVPMYGSITYRFLTGYGWMPQGNNPLWNNNSSATRVGRATNASGGFRFGNSSTSTDWYLVNNTVWIQSSSSLPNLFWNSVTADVTRVDNYYNNSRGGLFVNLPNSHLGQGAGHTNDAEVQFNAVASQSSYSAANLFPSAPAGEGVWLTHKNAPMYFGRPTGYGYTGGYDGQITKEEGVLEWYKPIKLATYTVSSLATAFPCAAGTTGMKAYVTDAVAPAYMVALTGGGAVVVPAFCNGTAWVAD